MSQATTFTWFFGLPAKCLNESGGKEVTNEARHGEVWDPEGLPVAVPLLPKPSGALPGMQ